MKTVKNVSLIILGLISSGFLLFGMLTVGLTVLGIAAGLALVGFAAKPFLPDDLKKPVIIDVSPLKTSEH